MVAVFQNLLSLSSREYFGASGVFDAHVMLKMSARAYEAQKCCPDSRLTRY